MVAAVPNETGQIKTPLVWSKLQPPVSRQRVIRTALVARCTGTPRKITLIRAPAGWGKSTLLADWYALEGAERPFAWLALEQADNDPVRFWTYLIEALRTHNEQTGAASLPMLSIPRADVIAEVLPTLCNELVALPDRTVLVLDDYHVISYDAIHRGLAFLLTHLPPNLELALASRSEPALPLALLRARGELVEIDTRQLSFSDDETGMLLNDLHGLGLGPHAVARLRRRTEGWAAGLYLAALTMRTTSDTAAFIEDFAGDHRHIVDYLSAEVLAGLDDNTRDFLLQTSVLERFCAPLCDAVTTRSDSARQLLELEASNFFLVPLDARREWYRYHALFAELLRRELALATPIEVDTLHRRASAWHRQFGDRPDAIAHATAAGDVVDATALILNGWREARDRAQLETLLAWLDALPPDAANHDARLGLIRATTLQEIGRIDDAEHWLGMTERSLERAPPTAGPAELSVASGIAACRSVNQYFTGDAGGILRTAQDVLDRHLAVEDYWDCVLLTTFGAALFVRGEREEAALVLDRALSTGQRCGHTLAAVHAFGWNVVVHHELGERDRASELMARADALLHDHSGLTTYYGTAVAHVARGKLLHDCGQLSEANDELSRGLLLAERGNARFELAYGSIVHAEIALCLGDRPAAADRLAAARRATAACVDPGALGRYIDTVSQNLEPRRRKVPTPFNETLSERELAVLRLLRTDLTQREIGEELFVSFNTVKSHTKTLFRKLGVASRPDAVARAKELGLLL